MRGMFLGIDTGGTYTDAVIFDAARGVIAKAKALTTRHDLGIGVAGAIRGAMQRAGIGGDAIKLVSLSTTLATNALVEGQRRPVGLVMIGFTADDLHRAGLAAALGRDPVLFVPGGHNFAGHELCALDEAALRDWLVEAAPRVQGFAVGGLFATRNRSHEQRAAQIIRDMTGLPVSASHMLAQALDGPKRALTALLNARLIGLISDLITVTRDFLVSQSIEAPLMVVRGDGALIAADMARERPIETILSGPAATLVGASYLSGTPDALVSDIGGTTTDIAILRDGQPRIDPEGALVGGFRTMVEAVAMTTIGLGGDSEAQLHRSGLGMSLTLGPRRAIPVSLLAMDHEEVVLGALKRQMEREAPSEIDGCFAVRLPVKAEAASGLIGMEASVFQSIDASAVPLDLICAKRAQLGALQRLVTNGFVTLSKVTPSDAAHVAGRYSAWNGEAAGLALALFARQRDPRGKPAYETAAAAAEAILTKLVRLSAEAVIDVAGAEDGYKGTPLSQHLLIQKQLDQKQGLSRLRFETSLPVIGVGASANAYYPAVGALLDAQVILPEHADVANAVGAVVGHVRIIRSAVVTEPSEGRFRINGIDGAAVHSSAETAITAAMAALQAIALNDALLAGAAEPSVTLARADKTVIADGLTVFVESVITATAIGRPKLGE
jgi:N-methylhydantoinase A/oxoprolinase/acetone carboxylase beta subunit